LVERYLPYEELISKYWTETQSALELGPCIDLACGDCRHGIALARKGATVICCDRSERALNNAKNVALNAGVTVKFWQKDLEIGDESPLPQEHFGVILVFRYLYRRLFPEIRAALKPGGLLIYETFTTQQPQFGKPKNPSFLLKPGELRMVFGDWRVLHYIEGIVKDPDRAVAQIVCKKS